jgi:site-specific DNA recombinase
VLSGIKQRLLAPELVADFVRAYGEELADAEREAARVRLHAEAELADVGRRLKGVLSAIEAGAFDETLRGRLDGLESRKAEIEAAIRTTIEPAPPARLHPASAELYQARVADLEAALNDPEIRMEAAEALRGLLDRVALTPDPEAPDGLRVELYGDLAEIMALGNRQRDSSVGPGGSGRGRRSQLSVVAGTCNHLDLLLIG